MTSDLRPAKKRLYLRAQRWWVFATVGVLTVNLTARVVSGGVSPKVLIADAVALLIGAAVIGAALRRAPDMTLWARRCQGALAIGFVLGAVRATLWSAGLPVLWANLAALMGALAAAVAALVLAAGRRRTTDARGSR